MCPDLWNEKVNVSDKNSVEHKRIVISCQVNSLFVRNSIKLLLLRITLLGMQCDRTPRRQEDVTEQTAFLFSTSQCYSSVTRA
jgi:hypothetical protein